MRLRWVFSIWVLICAQLSAVEKPPEGVAIAVVKTWSDLARQPVVELNKNATARFGVQALRAPRYSSVVIYCMTEAFDPDDDSEPNAEGKLGPFRLSVRKPGEEAEPDEARTLKAKLEPGKRDYGRLVFAKTLFLEGLGTHVVELQNGKDVVVASVRIECVEAPFHPWSTLVPVDEAAGKPDEETESSPQSTLRTATGEIGFPKLSGGMPVLYWLSSGKRGPQRFAEDDPLPTMPEGDEKAPEPITAAQTAQSARWIADLSSADFLTRSDASVALLALGPGASDVLRRAARQTGDAETLLRLRTIVDTYDGPFHIEMDGRDLVFKTKDLLDPAVFEAQLLARWWINGKPVKPKIDAKESEGVLQLATNPSKQMRARLRIDLEALGAKRGDRIGLQMLWCPDGVKKSGDDSAEAAGKPEAISENDASDEDEFPEHQPIVSNRIEFKAP